MPRISEPVSVKRRSDSKTFRFSLNPTSGLPDRICREWRQRSFQDLPDELAEYRNPKTKALAKTGAHALIAYLKKKLEEGSDARRVVAEDITAGEWMVKFTDIKTSPRTAINAARGRPYSAKSPKTYKTYWDNQIKEDPLCDLKMAEIEEEDIMEFISRMSVKKIMDGKMPMAGTRTFKGVVVFLKMTFKEYHRQNRTWINPCQYLDSPKYFEKIRDALPEDELLKLFYPGVLRRPMELAVCAAIFLSGLRRGEVSALKPEDLDWRTPKIIVRRAWQDFESKECRVLGPPKSKKERTAPFDPVLQEAIKKVWVDNGKHEFVFSEKTGEPIGPSWTYHNFKKWLKRARIDLAGRILSPHSARHSLASMLEARKISLRHIQDLLGHASMKTTKGYLHSTSATIREVGSIITNIMAQPAEEKEPEQKIVDFRVS